MMMRGRSLAMLCLALVVAIDPRTRAMTPEAEDRETARHGEGLCPPTHTCCTGGWNFETCKDGTYPIAASKDGKMCMCCPKLEREGMFNRMINGKYEKNETTGEYEDGNCRFQNEGESTTTDPYRCFGTDTCCKTRVIACVGGTIPYAHDECPHGCCAGSCGEGDEDVLNMLLGVLKRKAREKAVDDDDGNDDDKR
eukprot:g1699.t1